MPLSFSFAIRDTARPMLRKIYDRAGATWRTRINRAIGHSIQNLVRGHFLGLQATRHKTSEALGATPTNYWGKAAESVSQSDALSADADSSTLSIAAPGIGRVAHDVDIHPTEGRQYLTLPIASESYGNSILRGETTPRFEGGFFFTSKAGNLIYATKDGKGKDAQVHPLYLLKPSVHQEQDRTLLPSDEQILSAATGTLRDYLQETADDGGKHIEQRQSGASNP